MNTYPQCPFCGSYEHTQKPGEFSCGTLMSDPRDSQTSLCIDREVAKECSEGLDRIAAALGVTDVEEGDFTGLAEKCLERIRELLPPSDFKPCRDCHTHEECERRAVCIMDICPSCDGAGGECEYCEGTGKF